MSDELVYIEYYVGSAPPGTIGSSRKRLESELTDGWLDDPRIILLKCHSCGRRWPVLIPVIHAKRFCEDIACECGVNIHSDDLMIASGADKVRRIVHGAAA